MSNLPTELKYAETHEWVRLGENGNVIVGITDHAQASLGDLVYIELPEVGDDVAAGNATAVVESVKAASDIYAPVSGEIIAINEELEDEPQLVNNGPYDEGWLFTIAPTNIHEMDDLLDAEEYEKAISED